MTMRFSLVDDKAPVHHLVVRTLDCYRSFNLGGTIPSFKRSFILDGVPTPIPTLLIFSHTEIASFLFR